jgi:hypothetical protein
MVDPELIAYLDQRFRESAEQTAKQFAAVHAEAAEFRQETTHRFQQVDETARHTLVLVEGLRSNIELLAEGFGGLNERLERIQKEVTLLPGQIKVGIEPFLKNLDSRVRILEGRAEIRQPGPQA